MATSPVGNLLPSASPAFPQRCKLAQGSPFRRSHLARAAFGAGLRSLKESSRASTTGTYDLLSVKLIPMPSLKSHYKARRQARTIRRPESGICPRLGLRTEIKKRIFHLFSQIMKPGSRDSFVPSSRRSTAKRKPGTNENLSANSENLDRHQPDDLGTRIHADGFHGDPPSTALD